MDSFTAISRCGFQRPTKSSVAFSIHWRFRAPILNRNAPRRRVEFVCHNATLNPGPPTIGGFSIKFRNESGTNRARITDSLRIWIRSRRYLDAGSSALLNRVSPFLFIGDLGLQFLTATPRAAGSSSCVTTRHLTPVRQRSGAFRLSFGTSLERTAPESLTRFEYGFV